jgi:hypothetical protein
MGKKYGGKSTGGIKYGKKSTAKKYRKQNTKKKVREKTSYSHRKFPLFYGKKVYGEKNTEENSE